MLANTIKFPEIRLEVKLRTTECPSACSFPPGFRPAPVSAADIQPDQHEKIKLFYMKKLFFLGFLLSSVLISWSQKKPLDHSVYDAWQSVGERVVSSDGRFVAYTVNPQEGDGRLFVESTDGTYKKEISRGYHVTITP